MEKAKTRKVKVANALKLLKIHEDWRALCVGIYRIPGTVRTSISLTKVLYSNETGKLQERTQNKHIYKEMKGFLLKPRVLLLLLDQ